MRFKPGQKVVCVHKGDWKSIVSGRTMNDSKPEYNEIVTVKEYKSIAFTTGIQLTEYPTIHGEVQIFQEKWFEPLMDITELTEILEQQPEHA